jgi:hypothetical protein
VTGERDAKAEFMDKWEDHLDVESFMELWWPQVDPREVLLWLADPELVRRHARGSLSESDAALLASSFTTALETGTWSVADVALVDDLAARVGPVKEKEAEERGFYEIEEFDDLTQYGVTEVQPVRTQEREDTSRTRSADPRERLLAGRIGKPDDYAHVLVDEAQDLSPMQCRAIARRSEHGSITVLGDLAQGTTAWAATDWPTQLTQLGKPTAEIVALSTGYRVPATVVDLANRLLTALDVEVPPTTSFRSDGRLRITHVPDLSIACVDAVREALTLEGSVGVIAADHESSVLADGLKAVGIVTFTADGDGRVTVVPASLAKGLEYDHVIAAEPADIVAAEPRGMNRLYVALTRALGELVILHSKPLPANLTPNLTKNLTRNLAENRVVTGG